MRKHRNEFLVDRDILAIKKRWNEFLIEVAKSPEGSAFDFENPDILYDIEFAINGGANVNFRDKSGWTPLMYAVRSGCLESVDKLIKAKANVDSQDEEGLNALMIASNGGYQEIIQTLVDEGRADVNLCDDRGYSAITFAFENEFEEIAAFLIEKGANVDLVSDDKSRALIDFAMNGHIDFVESFLIDGADINYQNEGGKTALMMAIENGHTNIANFLIDKGADINLLDKSGWTSLMFAVYRGNLSLVESIADKVDNINSLNKQKKSALDIAVLYWRKEAAEVLLTKGAHSKNKVIEYGYAKGYDIDMLYSNGESEIAENLISKGLDNDKLLVYPEGLEHFSEIKSFLEKSGKFKSDDDLENFLKLSKDIVILNLSYSKESFGFNEKKLGFLIKDLLLNSEEFPKKGNILEYLESLIDNSKTVTLPNENFLKIEPLPYSRHSSYMLIEYSKDSIPLNLTYCDGHSGRVSEFKAEDGNYYGGLTFKIDQEKVKLFPQNAWLDNLKDDLKCNLKKAYKNDGKRIRESLSKVVVCDEQNLPILQQTNIPMKMQERGNCSLKSINIVLRELLRMNDPEMIFDVDGKPGGAGYEVYKNYKKLLTKVPIENLLTFVDSSNVDDFSHISAVKFLRDKIYPKAVDKGNSNLIERLEEIFEREGVEVSKKIPHISEDAQIKDKIIGESLGQKSLTTNAVSSALLIDDPLNNKGNQVVRN